MCMGKWGRPEGRETRDVRERVSVSPQPTSVTVRRQRRQAISDERKADDVHTEASAALPRRAANEQTDRHMTHTGDRTDQSVDFLLFVCWSGDTRATYGRFAWFNCQGRVRWPTRPSSWQQPPLAALWHRRKRKDAVKER